MSEPWWLGLACANLESNFPLQSTDSRTPRKELTQAGQTALLDRRKWPHCLQEQARAIWIQARGPARGSEPPNANAESGPALIPIAGNPRGRNYNFAGRVIAPSDADETSAAYFANTPFG